MWGSLSGYDLIDKRTPSQFPSQDPVLPADQICARTTVSALLTSMRTIEDSDESRSREGVSRCALTHLQPSSFVARLERNHNLVKFLREALTGREFTFCRVTRVMQFPHIPCFCLRKLAGPDVRSVEPSREKMLNQRLWVGIPVIFILHTIG